VSDGHKQFIEQEKEVSIPDTENNVIKDQRRRAEGEK